MTSQQRRVLTIAIHRYGASRMRVARATDFHKGKRAIMDSQKRKDHLYTVVQRLMNQAADEAARMTARLRLP